MNTKMVDKIIKFTIDSLKEINKEVTVDTPIKDDAQLIDAHKIRMN